MTREPEFFKRMYLTHIPGQTNKYWFTFSVPIGTSKKQVKFNFIQTPLSWNISNMTKTVAFLYFTFFFCSVKIIFALNEIAKLIPASMSYKYHNLLDRIKFSNAIMVNKSRNKGEQRLRCKLEQ